MLNKIMEAICDIAGMNKVDKAVLVHLARYVNQPDGSGAYPGIERLARQTGYTPRSVQQSLDSLEREGWIIEELYRKQRIKGWRVSLQKIGLTTEDVTPKPRQKGEPPPPAPPDHAPPAAPDTGPGDYYYTPDQSPEARAARRAANRRRAERAMGIAP